MCSNEDPMQQKKKKIYLQKQKSYRKFSFIYRTLVVSPLQLSLLCRCVHPSRSMGVTPLCRCFPESEPLPVMFIPSFQVYGLLDALVTDLLVLADELSPKENVKEPLRLCT